MKPNPILEEAWRIKEQIAREADYDLQKLCADTRAWSAANLHSAPLPHGLPQANSVAPALREDSDLRS